MSVNKADFTEAADKAVNKSLRESVWPVYDTYDCDHPHDRHGRVGKRYVYAPEYLRREGERVENRVTGAHAPLLEDSLFLRFARLAEDEQMDAPELHLSRERLGGVPDLTDDLDTDKNKEIAMRWVEGFGVLGLTPHTRLGTWWQDPRGGKGDSVERFAYEAWVAGATLRLYEAATAGPDVEAIERIVGLGRFRSPNQAKSSALDEVDEQIQIRLEQHTFPQTYTRPDGKRMQGCGFRSLLGAMWIQMWWLFTADEEDVRHCPWCNRIIAFKQSAPPENPGTKRNVRGNYKTRIDKTFCNDNHRAKYYYHHRRKPNQ